MAKLNVTKRKLYEGKSKLSNQQHLNKTVCFCCAAKLATVSCETLKFLVSKLAATGEKAGVIKINDG